MGTVTDLRPLEERLDRMTTDLLVELRATKTVNSTAMLELLAVTDGLAEAVSSQQRVPRDLVGKLWFVFTAMLNEAEHSKAPDAILDAAWGYQERLRQMFGPTIG